MYCLVYVSDIYVYNWGTFFSINSIIVCIDSLCSKGGRLKDEEDTNCLVSDVGEFSILPFHSYFVAIRRKAFFVKRKKNFFFVQLFLASTHRHTETNNYVSM